MGEKYQLNENDLTVYEKSATIKIKDSSAPVKLKQKISIWNGCAIIIGVIVGSGIFVSPKGWFFKLSRILRKRAVSGILYHTGSPALSVVLWLLCGIYAMLGALCYAGKLTFF